MLRRMSLTDYWRRVLFIQRRGTNSRNVVMLLQTLNACVLNASSKNYDRTFSAADFDFYGHQPNTTQESALPQAALSQILSEIASIRP